MKKFFSLLLLLTLTSIGFSQRPEEPISDFGNTFQVDQPEFKTAINQKFNVVFDVGRSVTDHTSINPLIETAARFLNMHILAGVPKENINIALVIHGEAANDLLTNTAYRGKFNVANPNAPLITALATHDIQVILCGQTAGYRELTKEMLLPEVDLALSAMTALVQLQNQDYRLIRF
ncbi:hypothetical protein GCM10009117_13020 [Gangjinia marincola]|uniref:Uncharacterized protein n=1 Tax=Gangjinia marincola TaxID=578463 RepID=A0ABN1MG56_9FLAO